MKSIRKNRARGLRTWALAAVVLTSIACGRNASEAPPPTASESIAVHTARVVVENEPASLVLDGTLVADEDSQVTSVVPGRVIEVFVERGAIVTAGQPLVRLRDIDFRLQARAARAQLAGAAARLGLENDSRTGSVDDTAEVRAARTDMELAQANLARSEELATRGVIAAQALDQVRAQAAAARDRYQGALNGARSAVAALESARTSLSQASTSASEALVRAPFAGEIADRMIAVGEYVSPQTALVTLVRTNPLRLVLQVPQRDLLQVRAGQPVDIRVDALGERVFHGEIRYVSASVQQSTRGLSVEAIVPNEDRVLRPGLFVNAAIHTGGTQPVSTVPESAILAQAGVYRIFVIAEGHVVERVVSVLGREAGNVRLTGQLAANDEVAVDHLNQLADGIAVTVAH